MQDFIQSVVSKLGISEGVAKSATAAVLAFMKGKLDGSVFSNLMGKLPGAEQLLSESGGSGAGESSGGGGMLGGLAKMAAGAIGGGAGEGLELASSLKDSGLSAEQGTSFLTQLVEFVKEKAGDDMIKQIAEKIPALKSVLGS